MNLFKYTAFILISLISVYAPYVAYLNHSPNTDIENIDVEIGESISQVAFELSDHNFKIYWFGKYNNMIMCEKCLFNKTRRKKYYT